MDPALTDAFAILDPAMAAALLAGDKTQMRVLASSPLARVAPGDRIWTREACIAGRYQDGKVYSTTLARAEFMIFSDGWRQHRDGTHVTGRPPTDPDHKWLAALHMPRWASRITLVVDDVHSEHLRQINPHDIQSEGARPLLGGLLWRWPKPTPGIDLTARRAFARYWDIVHGTPGERWADDPLVYVIEISPLPRTPDPAYRPRA